MTTPANASDAYKNQIRDIVLGDKILTVGANGEFATIKEAVDYISTLTLFDTVDISAFTFNLVQYSDYVASSGFLNDILLPNDFLYVATNDGHTNGPFGQETFHYYPVMDVAASTSLSLGACLILEMGIIGANQTTVTLQAFRPRKFVIKLLPGEHNIEADINLPEGADLTIVGTGDTSPIVGTGNAFAIKHKRWGRITLQNVSAIQHTILKAHSDVATFPNIANSTYAIRMNDININGTGGELFKQVTGASCLIKNMAIAGQTDHGYQITADRHEIDGLEVENNTVWENMFLNSAVYHSTSTKVKVFKNLTLKRLMDLSSATGTIAPIISITSTAIHGNTAIFKLLNFVCLDEVNDAAADNLKAVNPSSGSYECDVINGIIDSSGTHGNHVETTGANGKISLTNVKRKNGAALVVVSVGGSITRDSNHGTSAAIATGATIAHGLGAIPTAFSATPTTAKTDVYITADATNLTVNYGGGGTSTFAWKAEL